MVMSIVLLFTWEDVAKAVASFRSLLFQSQLKAIH